MCDLSVVNKAIAQWDAQVIKETLAANMVGGDALADPLMDGAGDACEPLAASADLALGEGSLDLGASEQDAQGGWLDLAPLYIEVGSHATSAPGGVHFQDADGQDWASWTRVSLEVRGTGVFAARVRALDVQQMSLTAAQREQALTIQKNVEARVQASAGSLAQALRGRTRALGGTERKSLGQAALAQAAAALDTLDELLMHLQLAASVAARIEQHALGMSGWAIDVRQALMAGADAYHAYLEAAGPVQALEVIDRWCAPLAPLQLTEQMGLFADPLALRVQRHLQHLVELATHWTRMGRKGTPGECARVLAVWIDMVRARWHATARA